MLCLFRVVQEALQNAIKYSQAKNLSVHLENDADGLRVTITDDGVGFDVDAAWGNGVGLVSMIERLEAIGGALQIDSRPGAGTRVTASVPATSCTIPMRVPRTCPQRQQRRAPRLAESARDTAHRGGGGVAGSVGAGAGNAPCSRLTFPGVWTDSATTSGYRLSALRSVSVSASDRVRTPDT